MADNYVQLTSNSGTGSAVATLNGVVAGNALVVFGWCGNNITPTLTVSDSQGSYTAKGSSAVDSGNNVYGQSYLLENANSGTHAVTISGGGSDTLFITLMEIGTTTNPSYADAQSQFQSAPTTGTDLVSSTSLTISRAATLASMSTDSASITPGDEPTAGTGFSSRTSGQTGVIGAYRVETKAVAANAAATFTATINNPHVTLAIAIYNAAGGAGGFNAVPAMTQYRRRTMNIG